MLLATKARAMSEMCNCFIRLYHKLSERTALTRVMTTQEEQMSKCVQLCQQHFGGAWHQLNEQRVINSAVKPLTYVHVYTLLVVDNIYKLLSDI